MFITRLRLFPFLFDGDETAGGAEPPATAAEGEPTPPTEGTGTTTETSEQPNWQERYKEAQAWGTRLSQERSELETDAQIARALRSHDPGERQQALEALGLALVDDEEDGQLYDEDDRLAQRLEALETERDQERQTLAERQAQAESEANYTAYREFVDPQLTELGVPDALHDVIAETALNLPVRHTPQGQMPDLEAAWEQFQSMADHFAAIPAVQTAVKKSWQKTKPRSAFTQTGGRDGTGVPDFANGEERRAHILARLRAEQG